MGAACPGAQPERARGGHGEHPGLGPGWARPSCRALAASCRSPAQHPCTGLADTSPWLERAPGNVPALPFHLRLLLAVFFGRLHAALACRGAAKCCKAPQNSLAPGETMPRPLTESRSAAGLFPDNPQGRPFPGASTPGAQGSHQGALSLPSACSRVRRASSHGPARGPGSSETCTRGTRQMKTLPKRTGWKWGV